MIEVLISFLWSFRVYFRTQSDNQLEMSSANMQYGIAHAAIFSNLYSW